MTWDLKKLASATIKSKVGKKCILKNEIFRGAFTVTNLADNSPVSYTKSDDTITFDTTAGRKYRIAPSP